MNEQNNQPIIIEKEGRRTVVLDHLDPESSAMIQALYSRDPQSVLTHLKRVAEVGPSKFMASYYVGYGHKSIGDCGTTNVCIENVSLLAAKAIQDWPLYNGQEASTRYLNMSKQTPVDPLNTSESKAVLDHWMNVYQKVLTVLGTNLKTRFPKNENDKEEVYEKAIKAKAFDIGRGFLPAAVTTYLSWHTNLRQAHDHVKQLEHHPLAEIRAIAQDIRESLQKKYPNSFSHKTYPEQEAYYDTAWKNTTYFNDVSIKDFSYTSKLDTNVLKRYTSYLTSRPTKTEFPHVMRNAGDIVFTFLLDFGSYRDLQRQRSIVCPMPLLTTSYGFNEWYLKQLPEEYVEEIKKDIKKGLELIAKLQTDQETLQYYIPIGYNVTCEVTANLPAAVYVAELRAAQTVHPTLRIIAQKMGEVIKEIVPGIAMYHDMTPDVWSIKRGTQDITKK